MPLPSPSLPPSATRGQTYPRAARFLCRTGAVILWASATLVVGCDDDIPMNADADVMVDAGTSDSARAVPPQDMRPGATTDVAIDQRANHDAVADVAPDAAPGTGDVRAEADAGDAREAGPAGDALSSAEVWPADATKMIAEDRGGGFGPPRPPGSTCAPGGTYTMTVADRNLVWALCRAVGAGPYRMVVGERTLTTNEQDTLVAALNKVKIAPRVLCGADKPVLALKVTTPTGEKEFLDDFYSCEKKGLYVEKIDGVFQALQKLVP